ncbi:MAG: hypothetical protein MI723_13035 [Caulobacterales bacterium]|nr:hypothetical protein [Caulobacterales bacterium]
MTTHHSTCVLPALREKAGVYALRMARLFPAPHLDYLALPAPRRHLAHIYTPRIGRSLGMDARAFVRDLTKARLSDFLRRWAPDAPIGLPVACKKMGPSAWRPAEYRRLVGLLGQCPEASRTLRHAEQVTPALVLVVVALPAKLRRAAIVRHVDTEEEAGLVCEAVNLAVRLRPHGDAMAKIVERLSRADGRERFFEMLVEAMRPDALPAPFHGDAKLRPLLTPEQVLDAGRRFQNCLAECLDRATFGRSAFVEWLGEPPAVMELVYEGAAGWRLETLLGLRNAHVSRATRRAVLAALADHGVRDGFDARALVHELEERAEYA